MAEENTVEVSQPVEIHEAESDALEAAIAEALKLEEGDLEEETVEEDAADTEEEESPPEGEVSAKKTEEPKDSISKAEHEAVLAELQAQQKMNKQKEDFIQDRNQKMGALRKQLKEREDVIQKLLDDGESLDTKTTVRAVKELDDVKAQLQDLDNQDQVFEHVTRSQEIVAKHVDFKDVSLDDLTTVLEEDGVGKDWINAFRSNMYAVTTPDFIVQLGKRASERKSFIMLAKAYKQLKDESEGLKKKASSKSSDFLKKIDSAARSGKMLGATSNGTKSADIDAKRVNPAELTDAELERLLDSSS